MGIAVVVCTKYYSAYMTAMVGQRMQMGRQTEPRNRAAEMIQLPSGFVAEAFAVAVLRTVRPDRGPRCLYSYGLRELTASQTWRLRGLPVSDAQHTGLEAISRRTSIGWAASSPTP